MRALAIPLIIALFAPSAPAGKPGIKGHPAPNWGVTEWINLPHGKRSLDITDYRGRVLYLYGFQSWCPGCHSHGFPTLQALIKHYKGQDDVAFVAVQTVFEGYASNTFAHAKDAAAQYDLEIPVGQSGVSGQRSRLMQRYKTGGTPWAIIIDRRGIVRYNDFRIQSGAAINLIDRLVAEPGPAAGVPESRIARDLLDKPLILTDLAWVRPDTKPRLRGRVTLVRWFTDGCSFCKTSVPAMMALEKELDDPDFQTIAVYHAKPPATVDRAQVLQHAAALGYNGALANDADWTQLKRLYLDAHPDAVTSVAFVMDRTGTVRYIHPGPVFGPSKEDKALDREYEEVKLAVRALLEEK